MPDQANLFLCIMWAICGNATILNAVLIALVKGPFIRWKLLLRLVPWIAVFVSAVVYGIFAFKSSAFFVWGIIAFLTTLVFMAISQAMGEKVRDGESPLS
jgi:hypothetical protein